MYPTLQSRPELRRPSSISRSGRGGQICTCKMSLARIDYPVMKGLTGNTPYRPTPLPYSHLQCTDNAVMYECTSDWSSQRKHSILLCSSQLAQRQDWNFWLCIWIWIRILYKKQIPQILSSTLKITCTKASLCQQNLPKSHERNRTWFEVELWKRVVLSENSDSCI